MKQNQIYPVDGVSLAAVAAGIKKVNHNDLVLIKLDAGSGISGVFTRNQFCAAPVQICRKHLQTYTSQDPVYLLINTGNANAGTGNQGMQDAVSCCEQLAELLAVAPTQVFVFSTGVIGEKLPLEKISQALPSLPPLLAENAWQNAAEAILTTDLVAKTSSRQLILDGHLVTLSGMAKGSGMIRPDMATMLAYIATDLSLRQHDRDNLCRQMSEKSFNRITVDGDTSTNDCCMLISTNRRIAYQDLSEAAQQQFESALQDVFVELAQAIVLDGEGATKLIHVHVEHGRTRRECLDVAYTIAHSPLVKTAFFASDPNWGRILAAVGRSGLEDLNINAIRISLDNVCIVENGGKANTYTETQGQRVMDQKEIHIHVDLCRGDYSETVWSCDFSYDYVKINAEYRT